MIGERISRLFPNRFGRQGTPPEDLPLTSTERRRTTHRIQIRHYRLPQAVEEGLTENDKKILGPLSDAADQIAYIFNSFENGEIRHYPEGSSSREINIAARTNKAIGDPYTIVVKDDKGNFSAVNIAQALRGHEEYQKLIEDLKEAARAAGRGRNRDFWFQAYLKATARAFETGDFENAVKIWLQRPDEPKIDGKFTPDDTYSDRILGTKYSFESWTGILDRQLTNDSQWFVDSFLNWWQQDSGQKAPSVRIRVDHTIKQTGQAGKYQWTSNNLPCQIEWRNKYGSKFTVFEPVFEDNFQDNLRPVYRTIIDPNKRMGVSDSMLKTASLRRYIGHEISHSLNIPEDVNVRLGIHAAWVKELYCDLLLLKGYSQMGDLDPRMRERETALGTALAQGRLDYNDFDREGTRREYFIARSIILKYLLDKGCLRADDGKLDWDNTSEVFSSCSELLEEVGDLMKNGRTKDSQAFQKKYYDRDVYAQTPYKRAMP